MFNNYSLMIDHVYNQASNLYWTQDLDGELLTQPLKHYHDYMIHLVDASSDLQRIICRIVHVVTGVIAYPLLGAFAALGVLIKLTQGSRVTRNNENQKKNLWLMVLKPLNAPADKPNQHSNVILKSAPWKLYPFCQFKISPDALNNMSDDQRNNTVIGIKEKIDEYTKQYKNIYVHSISNYAHGAVISLNIYQTDSVYWKNYPVTPTIISIGQTDEEARLTDS